MVPIVLLDLVEAPVPFILGILTSLLEEVLPYCCCCCCVDHCFGFVVVYRCINILITVLSFVFRAVCGCDRSRQTISEMSFLLIVIVVWRISKV